MIMLALQIFLLLLAAYLAGCMLGCLVRRAFYNARYRSELEAAEAEMQAATPQPAPLRREIPADAERFEKALTGTGLAAPLQNTRSEPVVEVRPRSLTAQEVGRQAPAQVEITRAAPPPSAPPASVPPPAAPPAPRTVETPGAQPAAVRPPPPAPAPAPPAPVAPAAAAPKPVAPVPVAPALTFGSYASVAEQAVGLPKPAPQPAGRAPVRQEPSKVGLNSYAAVATSATIDAAQTARVNDAAPARPAETPAAAPVARAPEPAYVPPASTYAGDAIASLKEPAAPASLLDAPPPAPAPPAASAASASEPVAAAAAAAVAAAAATVKAPPAPSPVEAARPAAPATPAVANDDLKRIRNIDAALESRLRALGITRFSDIAGWSADDVNRINQSLGFVGRIEQENWIEQAQILNRGGETAYSRGLRVKETVAAVSTAATSAAGAAAASAVASHVASQSAGPDRLTRIIGIDAETEKTLLGLGYTRYIEIARWSASDIERVESTLNRPGRVGLDNWVEQARVLARYAGETEAPRPVKLADAIRENRENAKPAAPSTSGRNDLAGLRSVRSEALRGDVSAPGGRTDDLKRIRGVGVLIEKRLNALGVTAYEQIANWTGGDIDRISHTLDFKGRIERENWIEQARILASGGQTEFSRRVDRGEVDSSKET